MRWQDVRGEFGRVRPIRYLTLLPAKGAASRAINLPRMSLRTGVYVIMRLLYRILPLLFLGQVLFASAQNVTVVTVTHFVSGGSPVPSATICATAVDAHGNSISVSAAGWGALPKGRQFCASVVERRNALGIAGTRCSPHNIWDANPLQLPYPDHGCEWDCRRTANPD